MTVMWGLKNCDACRRARRWLETRGIQFTFHDVREDTPDAAHLSRWLKIAGVDMIVNRRSTTWRNLPESVKRKLETKDVIPVLIRYPTLLKRPILEYGKQVLVGFDIAGYQ
ncbi:MAG: Spx/MgsR family RNA polymerase-binding regulatory protein, partial [Gammaproteobacteria bacterium]